MGWAAFRYYTIAYKNTKTLDFSKVFLYILSEIKDEHNCYNISKKNTTRICDFTSKRVHIKKYISFR